MDESATPTRPSSWPRIEEAALNAFDSFANPGAEGLTATLRRAAHYATIAQEAREIVINRRAFLFGLVSYGILDAPSVAHGNSATWIGRWVADRSPGLPKASQDGVTDTNDMHEAFNAGFKVVVSRSLRQIGETAVEYAGMTVFRKRADLRHFLAAFAQDSGAAIDSFKQLGWSPSVEEFRSLKRELYNRIDGSPEADENMKAWESILLEKGPPPGSRPPHEEAPGFTSDRVRLHSDKDDPLGVIPEVEAFAKLICYKQTETPLSIGLFGGWGSGKSTFMQLLEDEIDELTERMRNDKSEAFVRNVVQVRFNAWQFADANLWASLTAEFFDQLRAGGYSGTGKAVHTRLVERVGAYVHTLTKEAAETRAALADSEVRLQEAQQRHVAQVAKAKSAAGDLFKQKLVEEVTEAFHEHKNDLRELGRPIGVNTAQDIDDFVTLAKNIQTTTGQLIALGQFVFARGWRRALALFGLAMIALAIFGFFSWLQWTSLTDSKLLARLLLLVAGLGSLARVILPGVQIVGDIVKSTSGFAANLKEETERRLKEIAKSEEELRDSMAEAEARRASAERAAKALARYIDPTPATANPPRLLRFMLEDDPDTQALEKEIGLISRVRRLFQALDVIVREEKNDPEVPDRIVIYIDDLDRCTSSQVYAVLQAIQLLLAFEAFVVVVAVDVAWIRQALAREMRPLALNGDSAPSDRSSDVLEERKVTIRYMEKIFQLPYWLRRLTADGPTGGSYGSYVRSLLAQNVAAELSEQQRRADKPATGPPASPGPEHGLAAQDSDPNKGGRQIGEEGDKKQTPGAVLATVEITQSELKFISSAEVGSIAGGEPRNVKRLVNIYRVVRTKLRDREREEFLGTEELSSAYPIVAILAAVETGQSIEIADELYRKAIAKDCDFSGALKAILTPALSLAQKERSGRAISGDDLAKWAPEVRRYSFNEYALS